MKKTFKILIPILLVIAILFGTGWYLFEYDQGFTQDLLLSSARYFESHGKHTTAQWFYNMAYRQAADNDSVAIELAEKYKKHGNYTKAEYTLYNAIEDGGGVELYIALCKTYVEQDKLLDALHLLDTVLEAAPEEIRSAINALRPEAPVPSMESQDINTYATIEFTSPDGAIYAVTGENSDCPSIQTDAYLEPFTLTDGVNIIRAVTVGDSGLVSPMKTCTYTVGGIVEQVVFTDSAMESAIRSAAGVGDGTVMTNQLWQIREFTIPESASSYQDLKFLPFLEQLTIENGDRDQLTALAYLTNLKTLRIESTPISSEALEVIGKLTNLESLTLSDCGLSTAKALESLKKLTVLDLSSNTLRDLAPLSGLTNLTVLDLSHNAVNDLSALSGLVNLTSFNGEYNTISSISPLLSMSKLSILNLAHNSVSALDGVDTLGALRELYLGENSLTDVTVLAGCGALTDLDLSRNQLTDITALGALNDLTYLNISNNTIAVLPQWSTETSQLVTIEASYNLISTVEPLSGLPCLNNVFLDGNAELESLDPLVYCPVLIRVDAYGTKVKDVDLLKGTDPETGKPRGVIVNYDPTQTDEN